MWERPYSLRGQVSVCTSCAPSTSPSACLPLPPSMEISRKRNMGDFMLFSSLLSQNTQDKQLRRETIHFSLPVSMVSVRHGRQPDRTQHLTSGWPESKSVYINWGLLLVPSLLYPSQWDCVDYVVWVFLSWIILSGKALIGTARGGLHQSSR